MKDKRAAIIGLGLIGGSIARALHERAGFTDITAVNDDCSSFESAVKDGVITRGFTEINEYVYHSDLIFICTPVKTSLRFLELLSGKVQQNCIITDVGSTKAEIVRFADQLEGLPCFIGGHPMTGSEKTGYSSSFPHLFENAYYLLTPSGKTSAAAINYISSVIRVIGGIPVLLEAEEHDRIMAGISHVPHIIASSLVNLVQGMDTTDGRVKMLAAGGFRDITRIASSSPEMWENITRSNKPQILHILEDYIKLLENFSELVRQDKADGLHDFFKSAKAYRDSLPEGRKGLINPLYEVIVDVVDKPGIIGEIATILGANGVNIKNISVSNSREFEQGCLIITLPDYDSLNAAYDLLGRHQYRVYKSR